MNLQQLEYVLAVNKHKHFGIAAENCHVTQATLSAMIKKLEEELEDLIFDRSRKPVTTTEFGLAFIERARKMVNLKEEIFNLKQQNRDLEGEIKIGIIPTIAGSLLPLILPKIMDEYPKLKLKILEITTDEIKQDLAMDRLDLGILATPIDDDQFEEQILYYEPMMVYGIKDKKKNFVTSAEVVKEKIWLLEEGHCFRNQALKICELREKEMEVSNLDFRGNSFDTLISMTNHLGGLTLIPELYYKNMDTEKQELTKEFSPPIPVREISIITYRDFTKSKTIDYINSVIKECTSSHLSTHKYKKKDLEIIGI